MYLSQTKAGELAGVSRGTISNRIKDGKLTETHEGIDVAELVRVFPNITTDDIEQLNAPVNHREKRDKEPVNHGDLSETEKTLNSHMEFLQETITNYREDHAKQIERHAKEVERMERELTDSKAREDLWKEQFKQSQAQALLPAPAPEPAQPKQLSNWGIIKAVVSGKGVAAIAAPVKSESV